MANIIKLLPLLSLLIAPLALPATATAQDADASIQHATIQDSVYDDIVEAIDLQAYFRNTIARIYFDDLATWLSAQPPKDWPHINKSRTISNILAIKPYAIAAYDEKLIANKAAARKIASMIPLSELDIMIQSIGSREKFLAMLSVASKYVAAMEREFSASYYQIERDTRILRNSKEMPAPENNAFLSEMTILNMAAATSLDAFVTENKRTQLNATLPPYRPTIKVITPAAKAQLKTELIALANQSAADPLKAEALTALPFRFSDNGTPVFQEIDPETPQARVITLAFRLMPAIADYDIDHFLSPAAINTAYSKRAIQDGKSTRN